MLLTNCSYLQIHMKLHVMCPLKVFFKIYQVSSKWRVFGMYFYLLTFIYSMPFINLRRRKMCAATLSVLLVFIHFFCWCRRVQLWKKRFVLRIQMFVVAKFYHKNTFILFVNKTKTSRYRINKVIHKYEWKRYAYKLVLLCVEFKHSKWNTKKVTHQSTTPV